MALNHDKVRSELEQRSDGEAVLHSAFGVRPVNVLLIVLLSIVTLGAAAIVFLAAQKMNKHFLVGVTGSRLLILEVSSFTFSPGALIALPLSEIEKAQSSAGPIFVRLQFTHAGHDYSIKFHRAAFSGNRDGALGIGQVLESGVFEPVGPKLPQVGSEVLVRWADGNEYPGQVRAVDGERYLCSFPNGNETWVESAYLRTLPASNADAPAPKPETRAWAVGLGFAGLSLGIDVIWLLVYGSEYFSFGYALVDALAAGLVGILFARLIRLPRTWLRGALVGVATWTTASVIVSLISQFDPDRYSPYGDYFGPVAEPFLALGYPIGYFFASLVQNIVNLTDLVLEPDVWRIGIFLGYCLVGVVTVTVATPKPRALSTTAMA